MPELPEVETVARRLRNVLPGKKIQKLAVFREKSFQGTEAEIVGDTIISVSRQAKIISLDLESGKHILVHLKMTGQLMYHGHDIKMGGGHPTADWVQDLPSKHTRIMLTFETQEKLFFNDMRVFGWWKIVSSKDRAKELAQYGPDVNTEDFSFEYFTEKISSRRSPIKQVIMDNSLVAGVGNIYACEALFHAGIHPLRMASSLSRKETQSLFDAMKKVIEEGITDGGTTFDGKYVDIYGFSGNYQNKLQVYGQLGKMCHICSTPIEKIQLGGRGTYFCPRCQILK